MKTVHDVSAEHLVSLDDLLSHLLICDEYFVPHLSSYVDVHEYALKLYDCAKKVAVYEASRVIALGAFYVTSRNCGFISNISVDPEFHSCGLGKKILFLVEQELLAAGKNQVDLQVFVANSKAMSFYMLNGYVVRNMDGCIANLCKRIAH